MLLRRHTNGFTLRLLILGLAVVTIGVSSCSKTVVETKEVTKEVHDTLWTKGPAFLRFISMLPDAGGTVTLWRTPDHTGIPFASAIQGTVPGYLPIQDSVSLTLYADYYVNGTRYSDSVTTAALRSHSLVTYALFLSEDGSGSERISMRGVIDSEKLTPPPPGYCYLRFINGLQDTPAPSPELYLDIDTLGHSAFYTATQGLPLFGGEISQYALVPKGQHHILLRDGNNNSEFSETWQVFQEGGYYTARIMGRSNSWKFYVDAEN